VVLHTTKLGHRLNTAPSQRRVRVGAVQSLPGQLAAGARSVVHRPWMLDQPVAVNKNCACTVARLVFRGTLHQCTKGETWRCVNPSESAIHMCNASTARHSVRSTACSGQLAAVSSTMYPRQCKHQQVARIVERMLASGRAHSQRGR
jgi:hypothetical protein